MEKDDFEPRISFSYARTNPLVVEKIKRRRVPLWPIQSEYGVRPAYGRLSL
jgi:hypothetical protein